MNSVRPGADDTLMPPPWRSTIALAIDRPSPLPASPAAAARVSLVEAIEDVRQMLWRNAVASVDDRHPHAIRRANSPHLDNAAVWRVTHRVGEQVVDHLLQPVRIAKDLVGCVVDEGLRDDAARGHRALVAADHGAEEAIDGEEPGGRASRRRLRAAPGRAGPLRCARGAASRAPPSRGSARECRRRSRPPASAASRDTRAWSSAAS